MRKMDFTSVTKTTLPTKGLSKKYQNRQVWQDIEGKKYKLKEITDSHLLNILEHLKEQFNLLGMPPPCEDLDRDYFRELDSFMSTMAFFEAIKKERKL